MPRDHAHREGKRKLSDKVNCSVGREMFEQLVDELIDDAPDQRLFPLPEQLDGMPEQPGNDASCALVRPWR